MEDCGLQFIVKRILMNVATVHHCTLVNNCIEDSMIQLVRYQNSTTNRLAVSILSTLAEESKHRLFCKEEIVTFLL